MNLSFKLMHYVVQIVEDLRGPRREKGEEVAGGY